MVIIVLLDHLPADAAVSIVVPNAAENVEGNGVGYDPFCAAFVQQTRYQQVYQASQFSAAPAGGYITAIQFRPDCMINRGSAVLTNTLVKLSTTPKQPDQLSAVFAENIGTNETTVYAPKTFGAGASGSACPAAFDDYLVLDSPFFYNPAQGNLLMEVRFNGASYSASFDFRLVFAFDAVNSTNDAVSRIFARSADATVATQVDTVGLVTLFEFHPVPSLTNSLTTNAVVITWPVQPTNFLLYWADRLATNDTFQLFGGEIGGGSLYHVVSLPIDTFGPTRFFRLLCSKCPPISIPAPRPAAWAGGETDY